MRNSFIMFYGSLFFIATRFKQLFHTHPSMLNNSITGLGQKPDANPQEFERIHETAFNSISLSFFDRLFHCTLSPPK